MTSIPRTPKRFVNWLAKQPKLPSDLSKAATDHLGRLETLAKNRNRVGYDAIKKVFQPAMDKFERGVVAHLSSAT